MNQIDELKKELIEYSTPEKIEFLKKYFKALPGEYGEGDDFIGVSVPNQRKVAKKYYKQITLQDIVTLLRDKIHEHRLTALIILVLKCNKAASLEDKKLIVDSYLENLEYVNNWDLVDSSAEQILGAYTFETDDKSILYEFAKSDNLWKQRIAIMSTFFFIRKNEYEDTFKVSSILINHKHDLIHKAVGWMLREVGNRSLEAELIFLNETYKSMPRTMLRYAIEKFNPDLRQKYLKGEI